MTETSKRKILRKLELLDEYLKKLRQLQKEAKNEKKFCSDFHIFASAERYLQLSCQSIIDTLDLIIIEEDLEKPENRSEQISSLYNNKIISEDLAQKLVDIVKFRNILVHEYGEIDRKKVYKNFLSKINDFQAFIKEILKWLKSKN